MKSKNLTINDLFPDSTKLTFLVGAGCSVDAPSCLPAGRSMMDAIIKHTCAETEIEKLLDLEQLRFEGIVEIIRDTLDPELRIIDYYGESDKPNVQHFFLAEMIKMGNYVMTTNFDFLIEYALLQSGVSKSDIVPVITKEDFQKYKNPSEIFKNGKKAVYKIHGSTKNVITGENTKDSLIATIQALGSNKEELNVFQIEPFKRPLFDNISSERSLIVIGYSGSDDFDIVPSLKVLKDIKNVIWINHVSNDSGKERIFEIDKKFLRETKILDKVNQILTELYNMRNANHIYRIDANTLNLIKKLLGIKPKISDDNFSLNPTNWLKTNVKIPDEFYKYFIPSKIYNDFGLYDNAMKCLEEILNIAEKERNKKWKYIALNNMGEIYRAKGNYPEALEKCVKALEINEELAVLSDKATILNNIGLIHLGLRRYPEAMRNLKAALKIDKKLGNFSKKASYLNNIAKIHWEQKNYPKAMKNLKKALEIDEQLGDILGKATCLNSIGMIYDAQRNFDEAKKKYIEALEINKQLGNLSGIVSNLTNIGSIYLIQRKYSEALNIYQKALKIDEKLENFMDIATDLSSIGMIYNLLVDYPKALHHLKKALKILKQNDLGDTSEILYIKELIEDVKRRMT